MAKHINNEWIEKKEAFEQIYQGGKKVLEEILFSRPEPFLELRVPFYGLNVQDDVMESSFRHINFIDLADAFHQIFFRRD